MPDPPPPFSRHRSIRVDIPSTRAARGQAFKDPVVARAFAASPILLDDRRSEHRFVWMIALTAVRDATLPLPRVRPKPAEEAS